MTNTYISENYNNSTNILDKVFSHATIVLESEYFDYQVFKLELLEKKINYISFDTSLEETDIKKRNLNFKIEDIQKIKDFQNSKSTEKRFIITNRNLRNTVIQNALLKLLEEPNENTFIVFFVKDLDIFLPTVLSRCQVVKDIKNKTAQTIIKNSDYKSIKNNIIQNIKQKINLNTNTNLNTSTQTKINSSLNISINSSKNTFEKLERLLKLETFKNKGLVSSKQIGDIYDIM